MTQMLSILMPTYNHEKYIAKAIESALMQKTSYSWELLIHDDCSTDNTKAIAREYAQKYPEKITLLEESQNQGLIKSYKALIDISKGKYLAILESDDYWIDENKIQKQIDFLEQNPDYGLVAGDVITVDENDNVIQIGKTNQSKRDTDYWYERLLCNNGLWGACSVVFLKKSFEDYCNIDDYIAKGFVTFDHPVWLSISRHKKCKYIEETFAGYRYTASSISNSSDGKKQMEFNVGIFKLEEYIVEKYGCGNISYEEWKNRNIQMLLGKALKYRQRDCFVECAKQLKVDSITSFVVRKFPSIYYYQFTLRHKNRML
ncbi:glycosyltransferase [Treponema sp.]|uniref:glycosyltransferase n=1 Tax=Treponema sp. TaxID=166 RepID=UPI00298D91D8|nr:glycosyltransferase [Treponema sp.]MCQ2241383.1 glycosyltransferase [Treponema sp.]